MQQMSYHKKISSTLCTLYTLIRKEMKCSGDSEILHGLVHDPTRISSSFFNSRLESRTNSCSILNPRNTSFPFYNSVLNSIVEGCLGIAPCQEQKGLTHELGCVQARGGQAVRQVEQSAGPAGHLAAKTRRNTAGQSITNPALFWQCCLLNSCQFIQFC